MQNEDISLRYVENLIRGNLRFEAWQCYSALTEVIMLHYSCLTIELNIRYFSLH